MRRMKKWVLFVGTASVVFGGLGGCGNSTVVQIAIALADIVAGVVAGGLLPGLGVAT